MKVQKKIKQIINHNYYSSSRNFRVTYWNTYLASPWAHPSSHSQYDVSQPVCFHQGLSSTPSYNSYKKKKKKKKKPPSHQKTQTQLRKFVSTCFSSSDYQPKLQWMTQENTPTFTYDFITPRNIHVCNYNFRKDSKKNFLRRKKNTRL